MTLSSFKNWAVGQGSVAKFTDGQYRGQCVSLINQYLARVYNIRAGAWGNAKDWATNATVATLFDKVSVPQAGDIGISGSNTGGGYGHIWIYLGGGLCLEQNGRTALKVTVNPPLFAPIAILRKKGTGGKEDMIPDHDNYYWRFGQDLAMRIRGRHISRTEFRKFIVGQSPLRAVEILSDNPEATTAQRWQDVGKVAVRDKWDQQIYRLQDQLKSLSTRPTRAELDAVTKRANELAESVARLEAQKTEDSKTLDEASGLFKQVVAWFQKLMNRR